jgi:hypothetical protein
LLQAVGRLVIDEDIGMTLVKLLFFENANTACQVAISLIKRGEPW